MTELPVKHSANHTLVNQYVGWIEVPVNQATLGIELVKSVSFSFQNLINRFYRFLSEPGSSIGALKRLADEPAPASKGKR